MEEGKIYKLGTDVGFAIVKLSKIQTYPASGMPSDFIFEYQPGSIKPIGHPDSESFVIPEGLITMIKDKWGLEEVI